MSATEHSAGLWRLVVVGGHTPNIGKTQLVCDIIQAFPKVAWIAGKITPLEKGLSTENTEGCGCAATERVCTLDWQSRADAGTAGPRFLTAGAKRSFWMRNQPGSLAECLPILRHAVNEASSEFTPDESRKRALIVETNSLMQFVKPSLYFAVIDPDREDFTESSLAALERANALVLPTGPVATDAPPTPLWMRLPANLLKQRPSVLQRVGEPLPRPLESLIYQMLDDPPTVSL